MENASKALLMAGGILISLIIIGALLLMFNQLGTFQKSQTSSEKDSQLATFNQDFARYADETSLKGVDIISLANKVVDYNKKSGITNSVNYDQKITLNVDLNGFSSSYLFKNTSSIVITDNNNKLMQAINKFSSLEKKYTLETMLKLKSNISNLENGTTTIQEATGGKIKNDAGIEISDIYQYMEYTEFKEATFKPVGNPEYENGQISKLSFKFVK